MSWFNSDSVTYTTTKLLPLSPGGLCKFGSQWFVSEANSSLSELMIDNFLVKPCRIWGGYQSERQLKTHLTLAKVKTGIKHSTQILYVLYLGTPMCFFYWIKIDQKYLNIYLGYEHVHQIIVITRILCTQIYIQVSDKWCHC